MQNDLDRETASLQELDAQKQDAQERLEEMDQQKHKLEDMLNEVRIKCQEESQMVRMSTSNGFATVVINNKMSFMKWIIYYCNVLNLFELGFRKIFCSAQYQNYQEAPEMVQKGGNHNICIHVAHDFNNWITVKSPAYIFIA